MSIVHQCSSAETPSLRMETTWNKRKTHTFTSLCVFKVLYLHILHLNICCRFTVNVPKAVSLVTLLTLFHEELVVDL